MLLSDAFLPQKNNFMNTVDSSGLISPREKQGAARVNTSLPGSHRMIKEGQTFVFHFENKVELKKGQELKVNLS